MFKKDNLTRNAIPTLPFTDLAWRDRDQSKLANPAFIGKQAGLIVFALYLYSSAQYCGIQALY